MRIFKLPLNNSNKKMSDDRDKLEKTFGLDTTLNHMPYISLFFVGNFIKDIYKSTVVVFL